MKKYYTRACNFYYGAESIKKVKNKTSIPLNNNKFISFDTLEIITRDNKRKIHIKDINLEKKELKNKIKIDLNLIKKTKILPDYINVGGGFPTIYPDLIPQNLDNYFNEIKKSFSK